MVYFLSIELPALFEMAEEDDMDTANCLKDFDGLEHVVDSTEEEMEQSSNLLARHSRKYAHGQITNRYTVIIFNV